MSFYGERILPRIIDRVCSVGEIAELRGPFLKDVEGTVLEIGFGSGTNLPFYSSDVIKLYALDLTHLGRRLANDRLKATRFPVEYIDYEPTTDRIPLPDNSMDHIVTAFTLCSISNLDEVLAEVHRVLKPIGTFHFLEHGRSPERRVQFWQDLLTPLQKRIAGGCHLNRKIDEILVRAGFSIEKLDNFYLRGPKFGTYIYQGKAH